MRNEGRKFLGLATALIVAATPARTLAQEMSTIEVFISQNQGSNNNSTEQFVGLRCTALLRMMSTHLRENGITDLSEKYKLSSEKALMAAVIFSGNSSAEYMANQIRIMTDAYVNRFLSAKALTGSGTDDNVISADVKMCGFLFSEQ